tara:strand:+ start:517 stop:789 length:273 start_codon:yes stop_codon:yes gene_type:complete
MTEKTTPVKPLRFELNIKDSAMRPEQLLNLLNRMLREEFPAVVDSVTVVHEPGEGVVTLSNLEQLDEPIAMNVAHRARSVYNEFLTSPWY